MYEFGGCGRNAVLCGGTGGKPDQVDTDGDEASEMFSPSDRAMALISSSCSPSLSVGLDLKLEP